MKPLNKKYLSYLYSTANNACLDQHQDFIKSTVTDCVAGFYEVLLADHSTKKFMTSEMVEKHLKQELRHWLLMTLSSKNSEEALQEVVSKQHEVGDVHARIEVPMTLVNSAMLVIKEVLFNNISTSTSLNNESKLELLILTNKLLDASLSLVNEAYLEGRVLNERMAQEYRTNSSAQEIAIELERTKGSMLAWMGRFMTDIITEKTLTLEDFKHQEFSLWIRHKLTYACRNDELISKAKNLLNEIESVVSDISLAPIQARGELAVKINHLTSDCSWVLSQMSEMNVESAAREDALTSLIERRFLGPIMQNETHLAMKTQQSFSVLMMDIDSFKEINDIHGHQAGDKVLAMVGRLLKRSLRVTDYAFRYGGEEFLVLMPETDLQEAQLAATKILQRIRDLDVQLDNGRLIKVTISIGIAEFDKHPDYEHLVKHADDKLYEAKHNGKDRYEY